MGKYLYFGEKLEAYGVRVLNEREVRAGAGILFLFAMISFSSALFAGNFYWTKLFIVAFLVDFFIRIFINPKYAPSLIFGRLVVGNQSPEYVGAPQKRFAWSIGFILAGIMFFLMVVNNVMTPVNVVICIACLSLLFFESAFGICIGCTIYNLFNKEKAKLCPGGVCEAHKKSASQRISFGQLVTLVVFIAAIIFIYSSDLIQLDTLIKTEACGLHG
jgi:hypothetical protein